MAELTLVQYHDLFVKQGEVSEENFNAVLQKYFNLQGSADEVAGIETLIEKEGLLTPESIRELMAKRNTEYAVCPDCERRFRVFGWSQGVTFPCPSCQKGHLELLAPEEGTSFDSHFDAAAYLKRVRDSGKGDEAVVSLDAFMTSEEEAPSPAPSPPETGTDEIDLKEKRRTQAVAGRQSTFSVEEQLLAEDSKETKVTDTTSEKTKEEPEKKPVYIPENYDRQQGAAQFFDCQEVSVCEELGFALGSDADDTMLGIPSDRYVVIDEIGRGATGVVLRAFDRDLNREVALKIIYSDIRKNHQHLLRFLEEAQVAAQLEHPNIVPIHDVGLDARNRVYFTMKLVHGKTLDDVIKHQKKKEDTISAQTHLLEVFLKVCDGVHFAHSRGVLHRDLKPDNIMIGEYGEVYLMDWGLAKIMQGGTTVIRVSSLRTARSEQRITSKGRVYGTPVYMSPEQATGDVEKLDERSDVYSLGTILYLILTFQKPFESDGGIVKILERVSQGEFKPPRERAPELEVPEELESIVLKAMKLDREERYQNARNLSDDIHSFLGKARE